MMMPSIFGENLFDDDWMILDSEIISLAERTLFMANMQKIS